MRSPEGHDDPGSLITDPPAADPPADDPPVEPNDPPADPPKESDPPVEVVPLTAEALSLPEGFELPAETQTKFLEILNGEQSPADRANALLSLHAETLKAALETDSKAWATTQEEWKAAAKADPEIGGEKLQPSLTSIGKLLDEYGSPDLRAVFDLTGAGNNPHMIRFLAKIAGKLTEGTHQGGSRPGAETQAEKAARMYPSMKG